MMGNLSGEIALWPMTTRFGNIPEAGGDIGSGKPVRKACVHQVEILSFPKKEKNKKGLCS